MRRTVRVVRSAREHNAILAARKRLPPARGGLPEALAATAATATAMTMAAGAAGLLLYACVVAGVHFGVQAVTYLQHWGLGVDSVDDAAEGRYAWEDRCQFQVWLMLHLALHHAHHQNSGVPYYRLAPHKASPRLPAGYVLLLFASFIPPLWRWLMLPALENWKRPPLPTWSRCDGAWCAFRCTTRRKLRHEACCCRIGATGRSRPQTRCSGPSAGSSVLAQSSSPENGER